MPFMIFFLCVTVNFKLLESILVPQTCKADNQEVHTGMTVRG